MPLGALVEHVGAGISRAFYDDPTGIPVLRSNNVKDGEVVLEGLKYWHRSDPNGADLEKVKPQVGDVLINFVNGSQRELGKAAVFRGELRECIASTNFFIVRLKKDVLLPEYLNYFLQSQEYRRWLFRTCGFSGQGSFNQEQVRSLMIPVKSVGEQARIVAVLAGLDATRRLLGRMIDTKRTFKRGLMHQLLTGRKRFPEHLTGPLVPMQLGALGEIRRGVTYNSSSDLRSTESQQTVRLLRSTNIQDGRLDLGDVHVIDRECADAGQLMRPGDIAVCIANGSRHLVGKAAPFHGDAEHDYVVGAFCALYRPAPGESPDLLAELFECHPYRKWVSALLAGTNIGNLRPADVLSCRINLPAKQEGRVRMGELLRLLRHEIDLLAAEREKVEDYRRALLSNLLFGQLSTP
jgi:type I restriction enzyme S subunit